MISLLTLFDFIWRMSVILGLGLSIAAILRRASASERHLVLIMTVVASLLLPVTLFFIPRFTWKVPVTDQHPVFQTVTAVLADEPLTSFAKTAEIEGSFWRSWQWGDVFLMTVAMGASVQLMRIACGIFSLHRIRRGMVRLDVSPSAGILACAISQLSSLPQVLLSTQVSLAFLYGWFRPCVILPTEATGWSEEKLTMVLTHEMAHIRRGDHLWQPVLLIFQLLYWWHPLAWLALAKIQRERESACDDIVLCSNIRACNYAQLLLEAVARGRFRRYSLSLALAMAKTSRMGERVKRILNVHVRRRPVGNFLFSLAGMTALTVAAAASAVGVQGQQENTPRADSPLVIETEVKLLEVSEDVYQQNREFFELISQDTPPENFEETLKKLRQLKKVDLVSVPKITTRSGHKARIEIQRQSILPMSDHSIPPPIPFDRMSPGLIWELESHINGNTIFVSGKFLFTEFLGFVEGNASGIQTPAFQTREAHFQREHLSGVSSCFVVPWPNFHSHISSLFQQNAAIKADVTLPAKRLIMILTATTLKSTDIKDPIATLRALLSKTILYDIHYDETSLDQVVEDVFVAISKNNLLHKPLGLHKRIEEPVPPFTFQADSISAQELFSEIKEQTGYTYFFSGDESLVVQPIPPVAGIPMTMPLGKIIPNMRGFVLSPHALKEGYVDIRGFESGTEVKCPYTGKMFLVP